MGLLDGLRFDQRAPDAEARAERALDAMMVKQLVKASGAFKLGGSGPEAQLVSDLFADVVAEAVASDLSLRRPSASKNPSVAGATRDDALDPAHGCDPGAFEALVGGQARVSSGFGERADPLGEGRRHHEGVDVAAPAGSPILAAAPGVVTFAGPRGGYGNLVEVMHADGTVTRYAHAQDLAVEQGQHVDAGEIVAHVGQTGRATGPHLHFEVRRGGRAIDPRQAIDALNAYRGRADKAAGATTAPAQRRGGSRE